MFQNTSEIIKSLFVLFHTCAILLFRFLTLFFPFSLSLLSVSYPSLIPSLSAWQLCSPDKCNPPLWTYSFVFRPFLCSPLISRLYLLQNSLPSSSGFCWSKEWSFGPQLSINSMYFIGQLIVINSNQNSAEQRIDLFCFWTIDIMNDELFQFHFFCHTHIKIFPRNNISIKSNNKQHRCVT